jgi:cytochrome c oxidase subunit 3
MPQDATHPEPNGPFVSQAARNDAMRLGMFVFLASETLLFAGLFALHAGYRAQFPETFARAVAHNKEWIGSVNTFVLLVSSYFVAWSELALSQERKRAARVGLGVACLLGGVFLSLKALEYVAHWKEGIRPGLAYSFSELQAPGASIFFTLYYLMTGLHALHLMAGMAALLWVLVRLHEPPRTGQGALRLELVALYWHMVDIIWIFLWPILYLIR